MATIKILLASSATTLWGRKINNQALVVHGMVSALRGAGRRSERGQRILPERSQENFLEERMLEHSKYELTRWRERRECLQR